MMAAATGEDTTWAAAVAASADRLPGLMCLLADAAFSARRLGLESIRFVSDLAEGRWMVALASIAEELGNVSGVGMVVVPPDDVERRAAPPIGCVAVDADGVDPCAHFGLAADQLLPEVYVALRAAGHAADGQRRIDHIVSSFNARHPLRRLRRHPLGAWSSHGHERPAVEASYLLDVWDHPEWSFAPD